MNGKQLSPRTVGYGLSLVITSVLSVVLVLLKETNPALMGFMKSLTSHHWITHGVFVVAVFLILGMVLANVGGGKGIVMKPRVLNGLIVAAVVVSFVALSGFYLFGD